MKVIKWKRRGGNTDTAQINGGELVRTTEEKSVWNADSELFENVPVAVALCFVPDPRLVLAGQIAAQYISAPAKVRAELSLAVADEILRQASKQQIEAE